MGEREGEGEFDEDETADGKAPGSVASTGLKMSRGELGEDEGLGIVDNGDYVGEERVNEEDGDGGKGGKYWKKLVVDHAKRMLTL